MNSLPTYLFVLAMETLGCLLERGREGGTLSRFNVRGKGYGDESVPCIVSHWHLSPLQGHTKSNDSFKMIAYVVENYLQAEINLEKNELIPVERVANVEDLAPWIKM